MRATDSSGEPTFPLPAPEAERSTVTVIRPATSADAAAMAGIYNHYIRETVVTFEEVPVDGADFANRLADVLAAGLPWLVAEEAGQVVGYAYAARWKRRSAYRFAVEITAYLTPEHTGRGIGSRLYEHIFAILRSRKVHAVIGGISLPNDGSVALHEKFGMQKVAEFPEVGFKFGRWIDVGYWQRTL